MRSYPCRVVGITREGRYNYILANVRERDTLKLVPEPHNQYDDQAVAVFHGRTKIGYIPSSKRWVPKSIKEGDTHEVVAEGLVYNDHNEPSALAITITITEDGGVPDRPPGPRQRLAITRLPDKARTRKGMRVVSFLILLFVVVLGSSQLFKLSTASWNNTVVKGSNQRFADIAAAYSKLAAGMGPAPNGKEGAVARQIIQDNYDVSVCPRIAEALRLRDGSIRATCGTGEVFRVFRLNGKNFALRCSVAEKVNVKNC